MLYYRSTRGNQERKTAAQAIIQGIAEDKGLFVPERIPAPFLHPSTLRQLARLSYPDLARRILPAFLTDFTQEELDACIKGAYESNKFSTGNKALCPVTEAGGAYFLELYHGRTAAFKDMALSILPYFLTTATAREGEQATIAILTATSGDTGKAALEGFADVPGTEIVVFFPEDGVSDVQRRQMTAQTGANTHVYGVRGNFDDCQTGVKQIFTDRSVQQELAAKGYRFSSANSINIGRLVPQVVYYVWAYCRLMERGALRAGEPMNVTVPTGNFGNILAAWYAKQLGLPIRKLICASNENNVLTDFLNTGVYDIQGRPFHVTTSPSMDILISSNLERLLYHLSGGSADEIARLMADLEQHKRYTVSDTIRKGLGDFAAGYTTQEQTEEAIGSLWASNHYLMDTHTAVAYSVYDRYRSETGDRTPTVIASTASPYKFADTVSRAVGAPETADGFSAIGALYGATQVAVPESLNHLENKDVRHKGVCAKDDILAAVRQSLR